MKEEELADRPLASRVPGPVDRQLKKVVRDLDLLGLAQRVVGESGGNKRTLAGRSIPSSLDMPGD